MSPAPIVLVLDGRLVRAEEARVSVLDRGFLYGDGVSDTTRARGRVPFALARHVERLRASCAAVELAPPAGDQLVRAAELALGALDAPHSALRWVVTRGEAGLSLDASDLDARPTVLVTARPLPPPAAGTGLRVGRSSLAFSGPPGAKALAYLPTIVERRRAMRRGLDDVVRVDEAGRVLEGGSSNVLAIMAGRIRAPRGGLAGITRAIVLELAREAGLPVDEGELSWDELLRADEACLTSSLRGVARVREIEGALLPEAAPVLERLSRAYDERFERETAAPPSS